MTSSTDIFQKCMVCKKKIMFSGKCKCENYYCEKHRFTHDCKFEHFKNHKINLEKNNPKIETLKIVKL
jgi:predicted nucleic acid binding AN1-type Zn finger protein